MNTRESKAKLNIITSLTNQIIVILCGLVVPQLLLKTFGSEQYGATTSITQFLSYISLLEGGIAGVARAELYKPLAEQNNVDITNILHAIRKFFAKIGAMFFVYVLVIAIFFKDISSISSLDWLSSFLLVIVISLSTFAQYFIGISYGILLQADQKIYVVNSITMLTTLLNTILIIVAVKLGASIIVVKLASSIVFVLRPIAFFCYVRKKYPELPRKSNAVIELKNKWTGFGQHIAYFLHSNTDVVLLTLFVNLESVAVYAVYSLVITNMQSLVSSFGSGMEALFGEMYAKNETTTLQRTFEKYEGILSFVSLIAFSTTMALIIPFIKLYTKGVNDANYSIPLFGLVMMLASYFYLVRLPYHNMVIAAGHFKQTRLAAYGEALINIVFSMAMVLKFGLIGVAIGTLVAVLFRYIYYVVYVSKVLLCHRPNMIRICLNIVLLGVLSSAGYLVVRGINIQSYITWVEIAFVDFIFNTVISLIVYRIFLKSDVAFLKELIHRSK